MSYAVFETLLNGDGHVARAPAGIQFGSAGFHAPADAIIVTDAQLLFNGDYRRVGVDLILSNGENECVLHDYFKGDKRAAIASPDGAHLTWDIINALTGYVQYAQAAPGAVAAAQLIGHVTKLNGSATAVRNGVSIILNNGDNVEKGDVVSTGSDSTLGITFIDGTVFGLSSNARMVLNEMIYDPNGSNNSSLLSLVAGTITFVAGETAKHGDMKIDTPVATMGIRGTAVLTEINFVVPQGGGDPQPQANFHVLVEPNGTTGSYILFDKLTLLPIATVNQAGQMIQISGGNVSITNALLTPDMQKLITDVFTLKFTDNGTNTKLTTNFTDTITPDSSGLLFKTAAGIVAIPTFVTVNSADKSSPPPTTDFTFVGHINLPPDVIVTSGTLQRVGTTSENAIDSISGKILFTDVNGVDLPTVKATFDSFRLQDANHSDITSTLTSEQLAALQALPGALVLTPDPGNNNNGSVTWNYAIADKQLEFIGPNETLTLTFTIEVASNYAPANVSTLTTLTITINGPALPTLATTNGHIDEMLSTGDPTIDHTAGTIIFADADVSARPQVRAQFSSFSYQDASHNDVTSSLTDQQKIAIAALEVPLSLTPTPPTNAGTVAWSYGVADSKLDFLAAGEKLLLTYVAVVDDGHGNLASQPITITLTGTNDTPTVAATSASILELPGSNNSDVDSCGGTITFNDVDLTDHPIVSAQFTSFSYADATHQDITSLLTSNQLADVAAVETALSLVQSTNNLNNGSVDWAYHVPDKNLDFLAAGDTLTLAYVATVDDGRGGIATTTINVALVGTNDVPAIVGATEPDIITVITPPSSAEIRIIAPGANLNDIGLPIETFDSQPLGLLFDNGAGFGSFFSSAIGANFVGVGNAGVVNGSLDGVTAAPFVGPLPGHEDMSNYLTVGAGGTETISFAGLQNAFGLYWGSVDPTNSISFYHGSILVASYSGNDISPLFANGNQGSFGSNGYVEFSGLTPFDRVVLAASSNAFEIDNVSAGSIHAELAAPITGSLEVSDRDIGDTLTGFAAGDAFITYNGSALLPANADVAALISSSALKFSSTISDGGTNTVDWSYLPTSPNLDFLKPGDTLTITYEANVTDGHGVVGSQPITVTIGGAVSGADLSNFSVVNGTSQNDTFNNVGNGVTVFGAGGQDTFNFKPGFVSATIGDFNVNTDVINIDHSLFASVAAILASAQLTNFGHDTTITDSAHDQIILTGVTPAQIQSHPGNFHLV